MANRAKKSAPKKSAPKKKSAAKKPAAKKSAAKKPAAKPAGDESAALISRMEARYSRTLPDRYKRFLSSGEHEKHSKVVLAGFIRGPYNLDFVDPDLADLSQLGYKQGIHDIDDVPWDAKYASYVPLAVMWHPELDEPKLFLVLDTATLGNPVLLFDHEGWALYPLAKTFDGFLKALPKATNDISKSFRPS
jgi:hypothetical protein